MERFIINNRATETFLAMFRDALSNPSDCNTYVENLSFFLAGAISNLLDQKEKSINTPLGIKNCMVISEPVVLIPVLRAGFSMLSGFQKILPYSEIGIIWAHRDKNGDATIDKYKFPKNMKNKTVIILDTMLATGGTINKCTELLEKENVKRILCASVLATKKGMDNLSAKIDAVFCVDSSDELDENKYVFPGVGDAGDRLFG